jgi:hypothetical protein
MRFIASSSSVAGGALRVAFWNECACRVSGRPALPPSFGVSTHWSRLQQSRFKDARDFGPGFCTALSSALWGCGRASRDRPAAFLLAAELGVTPDQQTEALLAVSPIMELPRAPAMPNALAD